MRAQLHVEDGVMRDITQLFVHHSWELDEIVLEDEDEEDPRSLWTIEITEVKWKCQQCFCQPCVTVDTNRQVWWAVENSTPHSTNHQLRKRAYFKFWTMLYHRGAWQDQRYLDTKRQRLPTTGLFKREIIPTCVLSMVRRWYPNEDGVPYMGHR